MKQWIQRWRALAIAGALLTLPAAGFAMTLDDVVALSRAGVGDAVILSQMEAEGAVFHLTVEEILWLSDAGVSDEVITAMIDSGKDVEYVETAEDPTVIVGESYQTGLDSEYRSSLSIGIGVGYGGFGLAFGYYYPWPGYDWACYYSPYWWWPAPRSYYYCGPWYGYSYSPYSYGYWGCYYPRAVPYYAWNDSYYRRPYYRDGRYVGNIGGPTTDRRFKGPSKDAPHNPARDIRYKQPGGSGSYAEKNPADMERTNKRPRPVVQEVEKSAPGRSAVRRPAPSKETVRKESPSRSVGKRPQPSREEVKRAPKPQRVQPAPRKEPAPKPAPSQVKPAPRKDPPAPKPAPSQVKPAPRKEPAPKPSGMVRKGSSGSESKGNSMGSARKDKGRSGNQD